MKQHVGINLEYKPYNLHWFELHAVDHCNLNCLNCNHQSLFFKKKEYQASDYFPHIDEMVRRNIKFESIGILGGEPFLHSDLISFVSQIKERYSKNIILTTNGFWLEKDYSKYKKLFLQTNQMFLSVYPTIKDKIGQNKIYDSIKDIESKYGLKIKIRANVRSFIEVKFTKIPEEPSKFCKAQANCTNLLANGKLSRCGVGAYAYKNPSATSEFLNATEDMFYDLTKDDGRDFKAWKEKYPLEACKFCTMWKSRWVPWQQKGKQPPKPPIIKLD